MYAVILAGGGGTRLRPLSRDDRPKPFLSLLEDRTLIQQTVDRLRGLVDPLDIHVVTDGRYAALVRRQLPAIGNVLEEPTGRNTAAAIAFATLAIDRPEDDVMLVLPADHAIVHEGIFQRILATAGEHLATGAFGTPDPLVTLGIEVNRTATEYGYLLPVIDRGDVIHGLQAYPLLAFEEKPSLERAGELREEPGVAWNAGMFLWRRRAIRNALALYTSLLPALAPAVRSGDAAALGRAYERLPSVAIDYAVMEPAARDRRVVMAAMEVGWSDIGGWSALLQAIGVRCSGHVVQAGELVHVGAADLAIVTDDGGLVIRGGPGTIHRDGPAALLIGALPDRDRIEQLLARVAAQEAHEP
jgi:mannose-1-phosphate guanylyltransferase